MYYVHLVLLLNLVLVLQFQVVNASLHVPDDLLQSIPVSVQLVNPALIVSHLLQLYKARMLHCCCIFRQPCLDEAFIKPHDLRIKV